MSNQTVYVSKGSEQVDNAYQQYLKAWKEFTELPDTPFNSAIKKSTFTKRMNNNVSVKIGAVTFKPVSYAS
jgi:hypothetical protein